MGDGKEKTVSKTPRRGRKNTEEWFYLCKRMEESNKTQNDTQGGKKLYKILPLNPHFKTNQH